MNHQTTKPSNQHITTAMLFAAGLGTRLRPLTNDRPKALVELGDKPLLERAIQQLKKAGITELVINVHHFADQIVAFLADKENFGLTIHVSDERAQLLETGGGLLKAKPWLEPGPFLVMNTDVVTNLDLRQLMQAHLKSRAIATLAIRQRNTSRYLLFDESRQLVGWENTKTGEQRMSRPISEYQPYGFSGIHVISPELFDYMPEVLAKFSIIDTYLAAAKTAFVQGFPHDDDVWYDVGKPEQLRAAEKVLREVYGE
jgi:NDP-sugar pyrophosphorylase family protein